MTKDQLLKIEKKKKSKIDKSIVLIIVCLPIFACLIAIFEYIFVKDKYKNEYDYRYLVLLIISIILYIIFVIRSIYFYVVKKDESIFIVQN